MRWRVLAILVLLLALAPLPTFAQPPAARPSQPDPAALSQAMSQMGPMYEALQIVAGVGVPALRSGR